MCIQFSLIIKFSILDMDFILWSQVQTEESSKKRKEKSNAKNNLI